MRRSSAGGRLRLWHLGLALLTGAGLASALIFIGLPGSGPEITTTPSPTPNFPVQGKAKGYTDATLAMIEYSDFQCPVCASFTREFEPVLEREYIATGKVRLEYRHLARIGEESVLAAEASECAGEQSQFWPYHDILFASQAGENQGGFATAKLKSFASRLGLDRSAFDRCLDSQKYRDLVTQETQAGLQMGVNATPTFIFDGQGIRGLPSLQDFRQALDFMLEQKGK